MVMRQAPVNLILTSVTMLSKFVVAALLVATAAAVPSPKAIAAANLMMFNGDGVTAADIFAPGAQWIDNVNAKIHAMLFPHLRLMPPTARFLIIFKRVYSAPKRWDLPLEGGR